MELIINIIFFIVGISIPFWTYIDAVKHQIGKVPDPDKKLWYNLKAGEWATSTFVVPFAIVLYLIKRPELIARAQLNPVAIDRHKQAVSLIIIAIFTLLYIALRYYILVKS